MKRKETMKQVEERWLVRLVMVVLITMAEQVTSARTDRQSSLMSYDCSKYRGMNEKYFLSNLNTTLSNLRRQLTTGGYASARTLVNGESVWGLAWCRGYVSVHDCLDCYDDAVNQLKACGLNEGAHVIYSDCEVRFENNNDFYTEANDPAGVVICDNTTSPQPEEFRKSAEKLILDLQTAAPRAPKYYALSTRGVAGGINATVYAVAQCNLNVSQSVCLECLRLESRSLYHCLPSTSGQASGSGCFMRYDRTPFFGENQITDIASLLSDGDSNRNKYIMWGIVVGVSFLLLLLAFFLWRRRWKERGRDQQDAPELDGVVNYNYKHLQLATNNFNEDHIIGKGGFGEVFKVILDDKKVVAVKKVKVVHARAKVEFENEILLISQVQHRNLLRLLGWSSKASNLLLVLEYMPNGSLDKYLWGTKRGYLNWKRRYDIILGIARGLAHLHSECHASIVHRDIKSSNILLDDDFQPKIADFGLARFQPEDQSHVSTKFAGTLGYTAPEYLLYGHLSDRVDTFSFGIVVLEIISGQNCTYRSFDESSTDCLLEHAWKLFENKKHINLVDETIGDMNRYEEECVIKIIEIALLCTQSQVSKRPIMSEVVVMLQNSQSLGKRQLTRPAIYQNRRTVAGALKNSIGIDSVSQNPINLEVNKQLDSKKEGQVDAMEKGIDAANVW